MKILLSFILLFSFNVNSQIIVTDLNPDTIVNNNEIYFLDLNNDGNPDFKFVHEDSASGLNGNGIGVKILHTDAEFMGDQPPADPSHWYPYKLKINTPIDSNASTMEWITQHPDTQMIRVLNLQFYNNTYAGQWVFGVVNHYLGVRLKINNKWHYGWILMDVVANATQMTIKSYAYRANPDSTVLAGEGLIFSADSVSNIIGTDIANNANASDISVSFQKAANENTISEFWVIIVPNSLALTFNLQAAQSLNINSVATITPNGANVNITLDSNIRDAQGNTISENINYVAYVLCKANSNFSNTDFLSGSSPIFMLTNTSGIERYNNPNNPIVYFSGNNIIIKQSKAENLTLSLYNISGSLVYTSKSSESFISIPTGGFSKGIYLLRLLDEKGSVVRKLVVGE
ncbi:MAG: T9SS type A sorting domain-containing protein [Bacteroidetes bacterium]|nr:T9SS type A sorting domain-containing protein [Bacteroidota bacterium]